MLFVLHVVCSILLVNCLLNVFVICLGVVAMVLFLCLVGLLLPSLCILFHNVFCLFSHSLFRYSIQISDLCCKREAGAHLCRFGIVCIFGEYSVSN